MDGVTTMVPVGQHRLEVAVFGAGEPAVVIEPSYGGCAQAWQPIAETVAADLKTTVVTYNRAPYGVSSPARDGRRPREVAHDLDGLLKALGIPGSLILVGHSLGGVYLRAYAALHLDRVAGMVLVDSSHEAQRAVIPRYLPPKDRVLASLTVPQLIVRSRRWRGGGDRRSCLTEFRMFTRLSAADQALARGALGVRPLIVLTRGPVRRARPGKLWHEWHVLQQDLARLSANSRHVVADSPQHYLHSADPELVIGAIRDVIRSVRGGIPLGRPAAAAESEGE